MQVLIVTLGKSETYKETIKEKSTILPYSIHKRIHVRPQRNLIQGIHVNTIQSTVLKEAAIRNSGLRHARAGPGSIRAKRRKESSGTPIIHDRSSLHTLHSPNQDGIPSLSESSTRYTLGNTKGASHHWNTTRAVDEVSCHLVETGPHVRSHWNAGTRTFKACIPCLHASGPFRQARYRRWDSRL